MGGRAHIANQPVKLPVACRGPLSNSRRKVTNGSEQIKTSQSCRAKGICMRMRAAMECNRPRGAS
eukprot:5504135-Lingulodinium_polyedra.AAC.1